MPVFLSISGLAKDHEPPLDKPLHKEILKNYEQRAKDFAAKNLNRFAIERLQSYDRLLDSLFVIEKRDTLAALQKDYMTSSSILINQISEQSKSLTELTAQKAVLDKDYSSLVRKAILSFVVWLIVIFGLLQFRKNKLKKARQKLELANAQLESMEIAAKKAEVLIGDFSSIRSQIKKLNSEYSRMTEILKNENEENILPEDWKAVTLKAEQLKKSAEAEENVTSAVLSVEMASTDEKTETDINVICDQYLEMAFRGVKATDEFNLQISRDFEKRLPALKINQAAVGTLLLNVLMNSVQSVKEKNDKGIKGYQPKISMSTRILPRFLQIRIKDNGTGMSEDVIQKASSEFFSTRTLSNNPGLGLAIANNIISDMHKGEIRIESEEGNSTDVYIKFFI